MPDPSSPRSASAARRVHVIALGCAKNRVDAEVIVGRLEAAGYEVVADPEAADLLLVETCGFIEAARQESVDTLLDAIAWKAEAPGRRVLAAGCLVQRYPDALAAELPELDGLVGTSRLDAVLDVAEGQQRLAVTPGGASYLYDHLDRRTPSVGRHTAYVKIAEGCDRTCSFCAVPGIRGPQRSRDPDSVVQEVAALVRQGVAEVNLVAQDLTAYGRDGGSGGQAPRLETLLDRIAREAPPRWLRLLYAYPSEVSEALARRLGQAPVVPYLDVPIQHVDDQVLRQMRRGYRGDQVRRLLDRLREAVPGLWLRTTLLTGFPGETEAAFRALCAFVQQAEVDHLGVFAFSPEEGTPAAQLTPVVPPEVAEARAAELMEIQRSVSRRRLARLVDTSLTLLLEGVSPDSEFLRVARHAGQAPEVDGQVVVADVPAGLAPGTFVTARVEQTGDYDLVARFEALADAPAEGPAAPARPTLAPDAG